MNLPPYNTFPIISSDRIELREVQTSDLKDMLDISYYGIKKANTIEEALEMLEKINEDYTNGNSIHWAIKDKTTNNIVGTCGFYRGFENEAGELGFILLPQYKGKGYMTQALPLWIDFGLRKIGLKRIWAITFKQNEPAIKLLKKLDFKKVAEFDNDEIIFELMKK